MEAAADNARRREQQVHTVVAEREPITPDGLKPLWTPAAGGSQLL